MTFSIKSGGVPGLTVGLRTPSWNECINVSSKSRTRVFLLTIPKIKIEKGYKPFLVFKLYSIQIGVEKEMRKKLGNFDLQLKIHILASYILNIFHKILLISKHFSRLPK